GNETCRSSGGSAVSTPFSLRAELKGVEVAPGVTLRYWEAGAGRVLVMLPGLGHAASLYKYQLEGLCDEFRVIALDPRGHGESDVESAMDELAVALKIDPMELRLRCYSDRNQNDNRPFSSKALRECSRQGAEAFGWNRRSPEPRSMRDGSDLVGWGMATAVWDAMQMPIAVRIALTSNGHAEVACATSDIGTGTYTIMAQVAADMLGLPIDNVSIKLGDSSLPQSPVEGGS